MNDIKNLFDVHNPQTIPDLGVKFQTIGLFDPYTSEKSLSTEVRTYVRTYVLLGVLIRAGGPLPLRIVHRIVRLTCNLRMCRSASISGAPLTQATPTINIMLTRTERASHCDLHDDDIGLGRALC